MPQLDLATYPQQLFWLLISFTVLYLLVRWVALPRILRVFRGRRERIDNDLKEAEQLRDKAEQARVALESTHAGALADSQAQHREVMQAIAMEKARHQEQLAARLGAEATEAERRIAAEIETASGEIPDIAVTVVQSVTEQLTGTAATDDEARAAVAAVAGQERG